MHVDRRIFFWLSVILVFYFQSASAQVNYQGRKPDWEDKAGNETITTINFDDIDRAPNQNVIKINGDEFSKEPGNPTIFEGLGASGIFVGNPAPTQITNPPSGENMLGPDGSGSIKGILTITFEEPINAIGATFLDVEDDFKNTGFSIKPIDSDDPEQNVRFSNKPIEQAVFLGFESVIPFLSVDIHFATGPGIDGVLIDDLVYFNSAKDQITFRSLNSGSAIDGQPVLEGSSAPINGDEEISIERTATPSGELANIELSCDDASTFIKLFVMDQLGRRLLDYPVESDRTEFTLTHDSIRQVLTKVRDACPGRSKRFLRDVSALSVDAVFQLNLRRGGMGLKLEEIQDVALDVDTEVATIRLSGMDFVEVSHDPRGRVSTVAVIEGSAMITPKNTAIAPFSLEPGLLVKISDSGVSQTPVEIVFEDGFE